MGGYISKIPRTLIGCRRTTLYVIARTCSLYYSITEDLSCNVILGRCRDAISASQPEFDPALASSARGSAEFAIQEEKKPTKYQDNQNERICRYPNSQLCYFSRRSLFLSLRCRYSVKCTIRNRKNEDETHAHPSGLSGRLITDDSMRKAQRGGRESIESARIVLYSKQRRGRNNCVYPLRTAIWPLYYDVGDKQKNTKRKA